MGELMSSSREIMYDEGLTDYANKYKKTLQCEVLQEILQEIEERINNCGDGTFKDGLCEAFDIVYTKIKELSE